MKNIWFWLMLVSIHAFVLGIIWACVSNLAWPYTGDAHSSVVVERNIL